MTVFYVLLYYVWRKRYHVEGRKGLTIAVYVLSATRVLLCMMPQNQWLTNKTPLAWGILRNIPFALLGLLVIVLFYRQGLMGTKEFSWDAIFAFFGKIGRFFKNLFTGQKAVKGGAANE